MAKINRLNDFFIETLKDLYSAEKQILKELLLMAKTVTSNKLQEALKTHLLETEIHVERLDSISKIIRNPLSGKKCAAIEAILKEGKNLLKSKCTPGLMDAILISAVQKAEHYEIAGYGCAAAYAGLLKNSAAKKLLAETLEEETATDKKLTGIAKGMNTEAINEPA